MKDELLHILDELKDKYVDDLIKSGAYSEWNKGILAGKIDMIEELKTLLSKWQT